MPIPADVVQTNILAVPPDITLGALLSQLPPKRMARLWMYVVVPAGAGRFYVLRWHEIEDLARARGGDLHAVPLLQLAPLPRPVEGVEQGGMGRQGALARQGQQPNRRLVVLADGQVLGVLADQQRDAQKLGSDPFDHSAEGVSFEATDKSEQEPSNYVLGDQTEAPAQTDDRVINAWVSDIDGTTMQGQPLQLGNTYDLKFNVDSPRAGTVSTAIIDVPKLFASLPPEQQTVEIIVLLDTEDFTINGADQQPIVVPRTGRSKNTATFNIEPKHNGASVIRAIFLANNRMFQKMTITLQVGPAQAGVEPMQTELRGMTMASAMGQPLRQGEHPINLTIIKRDAGYQFILQGTGTMRATLNLSETQIAELVAQMREVFKGIVYTPNGQSQYVYQLNDTKISPDQHVATLKAMARQGLLMYRKLFYGPGSGPDARAMGDLLRQLSRSHLLYIEIVAERFVFPWSMLYDRDDLKPDFSNVDPEGFWGFKHVIEYTPEFSTTALVKFEPAIEVQDTLKLGFVCNTTIDTQMSQPVVAGQRAFLQGLSGITMTEYPTTADLFALLNNADSPAQLLYFYCHAVSNLPGEKGGVGGSKIVLSDGAATLDDLNLFAPLDSADKMLKSAPLVFMNCCQSAELSPYLYDGLVPYLITKGARGVIGTEVDTPAFFAAEFAQEFIRRFAAGAQPLGELLLALRREYLLSKNNVMGLVYALYSSSDIYVARQAA